MKRHSRTEGENFVWISYSDLSTTLMFSFLLFLLIFLGAKAEKEKLKPTSDSILSGMVAAQESLMADMESVVTEMTKNEKRNGCMNAVWEVDESRNAIRLSFRTGEGWFKDGDFHINDKGKMCLKYFANRWLATMYNNEKYRSQIQNLIIEGHTNSDPPANSEEDSYLYNLDLSQKRAFAAAEFALKVVKKENFRGKDELVLREWDQFENWQESVLTATGRSFSDRLMKPGQDPGSLVEDKEKSKRIEFRFTLKHDFKKYRDVGKGT